MKKTKSKTKEELEKEIKNLKKKCEQYLDGWKRALADFQNLKKQIEKEKEVFKNIANLDLILKLLPVLDNFDRALKFLPEKLEKIGKDWIQGIFQIKKQLEEILKKEGVEAIEVKEKKFDPLKHEAVSFIESDAEEGTILEVLEAGYKIITPEEKIIKYPKVIVSKGKSKK